MKLVVLLRKFRSKKRFVNAKNIINELITVGFNEIDELFNWFGKSLCLTLVEQAI